MPNTPNYNQSAVAGEKWTRACRVQIDNPLNGTPSILIVEEDAIVFGDQTLTKISGNLHATFDQDNPLHLAIYEKVNELYVLLREARDAELAAQGGAA